MNNQQKEQVRAALMRYTAAFASRQAAAQSLKGIDTGLINQVAGNHTELITDQLWQHIARQVGFYEGGWVPADTAVYMLLRLLLDDARNAGAHYCIAMAEGTGKTFAATQYVQQYAGCNYIMVDAGCNMRSLLTTLLQLNGLATNGTLPAMEQRFIKEANNNGSRLLIVDNAHLLKERVLQMLLKIGDRLNNRSGLVLMGTGVLAKRVAACNTAGCAAENRMITLSSINRRDIELVCHANGLDIPELVERVQTECGGNLHQAVQMIRHFTGMGLAA